MEPQGMHRVRRSACCCKADGGPTSTAHGDESENLGSSPIIRCFLPSTGWQVAKCHYDRRLWSLPVAGRKIAMTIDEHRLSNIGFRTRKREEKESSTTEWKRNTQLKRPVCRTNHSPRPWSTSYKTDKYGLCFFWTLSTGSCQQWEPPLVPLLALSRLEDTQLAQTLSPVCLTCQADMNILNL